MARRVAYRICCPPRCLCLDGGLSRSVTPYVRAFVVAGLMVVDRPPRSPSKNVQWLRALALRPLAAARGRVIIMAEILPA
jgi:hypothetical protein